MPDRSALQKLADLTLGEPVEDWAARHRADERSWRWISDELKRVSDGLVRVTPEGLSKWGRATRIAA